MRVLPWAVCTLVLVSPTARAAGPRTATVDRLHLAGDAGADVERALQRAVVRGLTEEGVDVVDAGASASGCDNAECASKLADTAGVDFVIGGNVQVTERNYDVTLELHGRDGRVLATKSTSCTICSVPEAERAATRAAAELAASIGAPIKAPESSLAVTSDPSGARVYVDCVPVGVTPIDAPIAAGPHHVEVRMDGYVTHAADLTVDPAAPPRPLAVSLRREVRPLQLAPLGWAAIALGAASMITGAVLVGLDENPYKARCDGADIDAAGRCRYRYDTLAGGVAGLVAGAAFAGGGVALVLVDRKRSRPPSDARAHLRFGASPRGVTLVGRF